ncbi:outer membrane protein assembly factor BamA [Rhodobacter sp. KR11]|uniref:outer membrane protein assembly factor BamA n=1 Tax=Rhodobacter sp. KR11 TaxID=2974588 RepID=UPI002222FE23|nr:outer membrane protein assembly factor BamA [Rhodobacter sp. KR11]MCW1917721.1 outer membrane protein assembly factor BamA [Rhodobacter sp. KR11]
MTRNIGVTGRLGAAVAVVALLGLTIPDYPVFAQTAEDLGLSMGLPDQQAAPPVAEVPQGFTVQSLAISGNQLVDGATITAFLALPKGEVSQGQLNDAWQRIFASGLFRSVQLVPQGSTLRVDVIENPMIGEVDFQGNKLVKDEEILTVVKLAGRRILSVAQAEADAAAITDLYQSKGRTAARVTPKVIRRSGNVVDLVFEIVEGDVNEIAEISFVGNQAFSDYRLRQILNTKQAGILRRLIQRDTYNEDRLELDKQLLADFYLSRGYMDFRILDASASYARERDRTFLSFTIQEGQAFKIGAVTVTSEIEGLAAADFDRARKPRGGTAYSPNTVQNTVEAMETIALQNGLNFVTVDPRITRNDAAGTVDVNFVLIKGERAFVERIDIEGNTTTLDQVIRRQFRTVEGDPLNRRDIAQAAERIRALGFFSGVAVTQQPGRAPDTAVVKVEVAEEPTGSLTLGAAYGRSSGFGLNVGFAERNFLGRGQGLTINIQSGADNVDSRIDFTEPALLGRDLSLGLSASYNTTEHATNANYDTAIASFSPSLTFPIASTTRLRLNYRIANETIDNIDGASSILKAEEGGRWASSLGYSLIWDTRGTGLNPKGGTLVQFGQDFTGIGGDGQSITTNLRALTETKVFNDDVTLRATFEGGVVSSLGDTGSRVIDRFSGSGKIRGFEVRGLGPVQSGEALGGNLFAVAKLDSEFPLGLPEEYGITGGAFVDVGSVWGLDDTGGGTVDDSFKLRSVLGLSLLWDTPIGPLRFDFTKALKKEDSDKEQNFDFSITTKF